MIVRSTASLIKSVIGAGVLSIPYAFAQVGWVLGTILAIAFAFLAELTGRWLIELAELHVQDGRLRREDVTYERLIAIRFPRWVSIGFSIVAVTRNFFIQAIYLQILDGILCSVWSTAPTERPLRILIISGCIAPFLFLGSMKRVGWVSILGVMAVSYLFITVVADTMLFVALGNIGREFVAGHVSLSWISTFAVFAVAYACHLNILPIWQEGERDNRFLKAALIVTGIAYTCVGLAGYLRFGSDIMVIILENYATEANISVGGVYLVAILVSYLLLNYALRLSLDQLIGLKVLTPYLRSVIYSVIVLVLAFCLAAWVEKIDTLFSFAGSFLTTVTMMIMPAFMVIYEPITYKNGVQKRLSATRYRKFVPILIATLGIVVGVIVIVVESLRLAKIATL